MATYHILLRDNEWTLCARQYWDKANEIEVLQGSRSVSGWQGHEDSILHGRLDMRMKRAMIFTARAGVKRRHKLRLSVRRKSA
jgi:hypothetical protein